MYYRRKILLNLIYHFGNTGVTKTRLQKLLFILCDKADKNYYDFAPSKSGCFSFLANKDLSTLANYYKLIGETEKKWVTGTNQPPQLMMNEEKLISELIDEFKSVSESKLIYYFYTQNPYFLVNRQRLINEDQKKIAKKEKRKIEKKKDKEIFTIGYESKSIDFYLNELVENNIKMLCDVRKNPLSMKYGFSKKQLSNYCKKVGVDYMHIAGLGIDSEKRQNLNSKKDYKILFNEYEKSLSTKSELLTQVEQLLHKYVRIALTCFEKDHESCHRSCITNFLHENSNLNINHL